MRDIERECPLLLEWECHGDQANKIRLFVCEWNVAWPTQVSSGG